MPTQAHPDLILKKSFNVAKSTIKFIIGLHLLARTVHAGSSPLGGPCSIANDRLDVEDTLRFLSDCDDRTFCLNGLCVARACKRDDYPFAWRSNRTEEPPLCPLGTFCPDEGSGCVPLKPVGEPCQMNRDEQCGGTEESRAFANGHNFNDSLCLNFVCMYANVPAGNFCTVDEIKYTDPDAERVYTFRRDNCQTPHFFCDPTQLVCKPVFRIGESCSNDRECGSQYCDPAKSTCTDPPETPIAIHPWHYTLTMLFIVGALAATCIMLSLVHKRRYMKEREAIREYYYQQTDLRRSMVALQLAESRKRSS